MAKYLLDTNHASRLMARNAGIVARIDQAEESGDEFGVSMTVVGELYFAAHASPRREQNLQRYHDC